MPDIDTDLPLDDADVDTDDASDDGQDDPIAALRAEIEERDQRLNAALSAFSATVGRLQSLAAKPAKDTSSEEREEYKQATELLDMLVEGLDETSLSPQKRQQIVAARDAARRKAETRQLKADLKQEVLAEISPDEPDEQAAYLADVRAFEDEIVDEITSYGLDPKDFDWTKATDMLVSKGKAATRAFFRTAIKEAMAGDQSASRLQSRKVAGNKPAPKAAGGTPAADTDIISDHSRPLKERIDALRRMGAVR